MLTIWAKTHENPTYLAEYWVCSFLNLNYGSSVEQDNFREIHNAMLTIIRLFNPLVATDPLYVEHKDSR